MDFRDRGKESAIDGIVHKLLNSSDLDGKLNVALAKSE